MNTNEKLYPLSFEAILKEIIWGGQDIRPFKGLEANDQKIGESWEISHVDGNLSVVDKGYLKGKNIEELIEIYGERLLGKSVKERFGTRFPLLIKFIDAKDNLSIQVHPDDKLAKARHNSFGKTEMWYVVKASDDAKLFSGFSKQSSPEDYVKRIEDDRIMDVLAEYKVKSGDVFFLPAGRVHAIGAGCFVAEIQQTSNITYRIYDYNRKDKDGNTRELHTEEAKDAINYEVKDTYRTDYESKKDEAVHLVTSEYFKTNLLELSKDMDRDYSNIDSFKIFICMEGEAILVDENGYRKAIKQGQSVLIPAEINKIKIETKKVKLLETFVG